MGTTISSGLSIIEGAAISRDRRGPDQGLTLNTTKPNRNATPSAASS